MNKETADKVPELPRERSGKDLWKTLSRDSTQNKTGKLALG